MRVHTYVIATDAGSAPNYDPPCVTLAVCKPRIRRKARVGDLVLAFAGNRVNPSDPHAVVWAGVVAEVLPFARYWSDKRFAVKKPGRAAMPDNFYQPSSSGGYIQVPNHIHGPEASQHDTAGINVLAFNPAWRFGGGGPRLPESFGLRMVTGRRGERVADLSNGESRRLLDWLNQQHQCEPEARQMPAAGGRRKHRFPGTRC